MSKRPDRFVVGFLGKGSVVYGHSDAEGSCLYTEPMTLADARREVEELMDGPAAIYELVIKEVQRRRLR